MVLRRLGHYIRSRGLRANEEGSIIRTSQGSFVPAFGPVC